MRARKRLVSLVSRLYDNIDQADQFDVYALFSHLDTPFLLQLMDELLDTIEFNAGKHVIVSEDELRNTVLAARLALGRTDSCYLLDDEVKE